MLIVREFVTRDFDDGFRIGANFGVLLPIAVRPGRSRGARSGHGPSGAAPRGP